MLQSFDDGEEEFFFVGPGNQLDVDGKSLGRLAEGEGKPRKAREVQPLTVAHGVPVIVRIAGAIIARAMLEGRHRGNRREKDRHLAHLPEQIGAHQVAFRARSHKRFQCDRGFRRCSCKILSQHRAQRVFLALRAVTNQIADHRSKEEPPQLQRAIESLQLHRLDMEALLREELTRAVHGGLRFGRGGAERAALENSDAQAAQFHRANRAQGYRRGERVAGVRPCHHFEECAKIRSRARHRPHHANPRERACPRRKMSRGWNPARRRFESANSGKMSGRADGTAAIAAYPAHGTAAGNCRRFAAARAACGSGKVPGIGSFPGDAIVRFVGHQEFRRVGIA